MTRAGKKIYRTLILDGKTVEKITGVDEVIRAVERSFREYGLHRVEMPPKLYIHLDKYNGDFRAMPGYIESLKRCAVKWVNVHPGNRKFGLPAVMAVVVLSDPRNGFPLCIMDGTYATNLRTGAAGAIAAKYLARKNSRKIGLVGCGVQARFQLLALSRIFRIKEVNVWGNKQEYARKFMRETAFLGLKMSLARSVKECVKDRDIIITTTPSRKPLVKKEWIRPDAHINAIGADARGKRELAPDILKSGKVVVDSWAQASHSGEINVPVRKKTLSRKDIYADIGQVAVGIKKGRTTADGITVFDSTGLAIQDVAIADVIYRTALRKKTGKWIELCKTR